MYLAASLATLMLSISLLASANSCVWLDTSSNNATVSASGYSPCDASSPTSTCCADGDACLSNGYCTGSFGLYRGACTDWTAGVCPDTCSDLSFVSQGETFFLANLYRCNGEGNGEIWWCGDQSADTTAQPCQSGVGTTFTMTSIGTIVAPVTLVAAATNSASTEVGGATASATSGSSLSISSAGGTASTSAGGPATSTPAAAAASNTATNGSTTLGTYFGLGIGLGVPLLAAIIGLTYFIARRKSNASSLSNTLEKQQVLDPQPQGWPLKTRPEELYGRQVYEVPATNLDRRAELGGREK